MCQPLLVALPTAMLMAGRHSDTVPRPSHPSPPTCLHSQVVDIVLSRLVELPVRHLQIAGEPRVLGGKQQLGRGRGGAADLLQEVGAAQGEGLPGVGSLGASQGPAE